MKFTKKTILNILLLIVIGLLLYTPTKVYFIRLISFAPSTINVEERVTLHDYNWNLKGLNTNNLNFNNTKGKVVFVNFWATWCPPCIAEVPSIQKLYNDYKNKVDFVFVSNESWNTIGTFYKENNYDLPTYNPITPRPKEFNSETIPVTFIIDKEGNIVVNKNGPANWNSHKTRALLDKLLE